MSSHDAAVAPIPRSIRAQALPGAIGIHLALLALCVSAVYTPWQRSVVTLPQWGVALLVAVALLVGAVTGGARGVRRPCVRLLLALAGLLALKLSYDPQLAAIPGLSDKLPQTFLDTYPGLALVAVAVLLIAWLAYRGAQGEHGMGAVPLRHSAVAALGLAAASAVVAYLMLHTTHDLPSSATLRTLLMVAQAGCLTVVLPGIGGGPGIGRAPHIYLALALILAFARNMAFPME